MSPTPAILPRHGNVQLAFRSLLGGSVCLDVSPYPLAAIPLFLEILAMLSEPHCQVWACALLQREHPLQHSPTSIAGVLSRLRTMFPAFGWGPTTRNFLLRLPSIANMQKAFPDLAEPVFRVPCALTFCPGCGCQLQAWKLRRARGLSDNLNGRKRQLQVLLLDDSVSALPVSIDERRCLQCQRHFAHTWSFRCNFSSLKTLSKNSDTSWLKSANNRSGPES